MSTVTAILDAVGFRDTGQKRVAQKGKSAVEFAKFPDGARIRSCLGGPFVLLHRSENYSGILTFVHPGGRREDFYWNGAKYDGHGMEMGKIHNAQFLPVAKSKKNKKGGAK
ncbi:MAG: hypothetical protein ABIH23_13125 [bacterium]